MSTPSSFTDFMADLDVRASRAVRDSRVQRSTPAERERSERLLWQRAAYFFMGFTALLLILDVVFLAAMNSVLSGGQLL